MSDSSTLFTPLQLGPGLVVPDRIILAPMCTHSAEGDGMPNDWHLVHLGSLATHGCSTLVVEATAVTPNGRIFLRDIGLWSHEHMLAHSRIVDFVHRYSKSVIGIQLAHAGRKASSHLPWETSPRNHTLLLQEHQGGWPDDIVAPSAIPWDATAGKPKEMSLEQVRQYVDAFADAAVRARDAGYQFIQIHAAHGYLIHQFLSPVTNKRKDRYGGSFLNRIRFLLEIVLEIRARLGSDYPLSVRFSCYDWIESVECWTPQQTAECASILAADPYNVHWFDCSSGAVDPLQKFPNPIPLGYQVPFAKIVKEKVGDRAVVSAVGMILDPQQAEDILNSTGVDAVVVARQFLREPSFTYRAAKELNGTANLPISYSYVLTTDPPKYEGFDWNAEMEKWSWTNTGKESINSSKM